MSKIKIVKVSRNKLIMLMPLQNQAEETERMKIIKQVKDFLKQEEAGQQRLFVMPKMRIR